MKGSIAWRNGRSGAWNDGGESSMRWKSGWNGLCIPRRMLRDGNWFGGIGAAPYGKWMWIM